MYLHEYTGYLPPVYCLIYRLSLVLEIEPLIETVLQASSFKLHELHAWRKERFVLGVAQGGHVACATEI